MYFYCFIIIIITHHLNQNIFMTWWNSAERTFVCDQHLNNLPVILRVEAFYCVFIFFRKDLLYRGFMLVLDRRREKWESVKSCLNKVQVCWILLMYFDIVRLGCSSRRHVHSTGRPMVTEQYFALRLSCCCCCFSFSLESRKLKKCLQSGAFDMTCIVFNLYHLNEARIS